MQSFNFGLRQSAATSYADDQQSRYVPSSIYSGPGPAEESPLPHFPFHTDTRRETYEEDRPRPNGNATRFYEPPQISHRSSALLNVSDPVAMHLLMETAISDSRDFQILSYEEVEQLKKDKIYVNNRIEATRRKLALERKLRDAAASLNRLYTGRDRPDSSESRSARSPSGLRRSHGVKNLNNEAIIRAEDEYAATTGKIEEYQAELVVLERKQEDIQKKILEHTAGILQMTHKGLKKNLRRNDLPRSPESMNSHARGSSSVREMSDDFDERSLYQVPEYVLETGNTPMLTDHLFPHQSAPMDDIAQRLCEMSNRLYSMTQQFNIGMISEPPPSAKTPQSGQTADLIQAHLTYLSRGLDEVATSSTHGPLTASAQAIDSGKHLEVFNNRLHDILERTNTKGHSPVIPQVQLQGNDIESQMEFSTAALDTLNKRVGTLLEQKDILTRQIQQQRELNSKSDAERDAHIHKLSEELRESQETLAIEQQEATHSREHINLLMDQIDKLQDESQIRDRQKRASNDPAVQAEREARKGMEQKLTVEIEVHQRRNQELQKTLTELQNNVDTKSQAHVKNVNDLFQAKEQAELELEAHKADAASMAAQLEKLQAEHQGLLIMHEKRISELQTAKESAEADLQKSRKEMKELEGETVRVQTELTFAKAELDSAYGSRAQRAADAKMNPAIQKEIDNLRARNAELQKEAEFLSKQHETKGAGSAELQNKVNTLQQELRDIMEDYEMMTKQSIEFEKERDQFEEAIDTLHGRCEALETQINEDKIKYMGSKQSASIETTSTMVLKNEFKKMMRDTRAENAKALKAEHDERRRLEGIIRGMKHQAGLQSSPRKHGTTAPQTPEAS